MEIPGIAQHVVFVPRDAFDAFSASGRFQERGRRLVEDVAVGDTVAVVCSGEIRIGRVKACVRPNPNCLLIEWTIVLENGGV